MMKLTPELRTVRAVVRNAIRTGALVRPTKCEKCGAEPGFGKAGQSLIQGHHHNGYTDPLDVQWLCSKCHAAVTPRATGVDCSLTKFTPDEIIAIRTCGLGVSATARKFKTSRRYVYQLRGGDKWRKDALSEVQK